MEYILSARRHRRGSTEDLTEENTLQGTERGEALQAGVGQHRYRWGGYP